MRKFLLPLLLVLLWQGVAALGLLPAFILPGPSDVAAVLWSDRALLLLHSLVTLQEVAYGFIIGLLLGQGPLSL